MQLKLSFFIIDWRPSDVIYRTLPSKEINKFGIISLHCASCNLFQTYFFDSVAMWSSIFRNDFGDYHSPPGWFININTWCYRLFQNRNMIQRIVFILFLIFFSGDRCIFPKDPGISGQSHKFCSVTFKSKFERAVINFCRKAPIESKYLFKESFHHTSPER